MDTLSRSHCYVNGIDVIVQYTVRIDSRASTVNSSIFPSFAKTSRATGFENDCSFFNTASLLGGARYWILFSTKLNDAPF